MPRTINNVKIKIKKKIERKNSQFKVIHSHATTTSTCRIALYQRRELQCVLGIYYDNIKEAFPNILYIWEKYKSNLIHVWIWQIERTFCPDRRPYLRLEENVYNTLGSAKPTKVRTKENDLLIAIIILLILW